MNELLVRLATATLLLSASAVVVQVLMLVLRPSSARVRQYAWFCVLIQGIVFFHLPVRVPWYSPPPDGRIGGKTQDLQQISAESPAWTRRMEAEMTESASATPVVQATRPNLPSQGTPSRDWSAAGVTLWLSGIAGLFIFSGLSYLLFLRQLAQGRPGPSEWAGELRALLQQRRIVRTISLLVTRSIGPALCWAPWSYRICVPGPSWAKLAPSQRRQVLRHELAHFERSDLWTLVLVRLLALPHWFNPFAWWVVHQISQSVEWACDEAAAGRKPEEAVEFAKALVQLGVANSVAVCPARAAGRSSLSIRIRRLMLLKSTEDSRMKKMLILAVAAGLVIVNLVRIELVAKEPGEGTPPLEAAPADASRAANDAGQHVVEDMNAQREPSLQGTGEEQDLRKLDVAGEAAGTPAPTIPPTETVVAVRIEGNQTISLDKILAKIRTRPQRPYIEENVQQDVRDLSTMGVFVFVRPLIQRVQGGVVVKFQVAERPTLQHVIIVGNDTFPTSVLMKECELKGGDAVNPVAVEEGRRRIEEYYQRKGYDKVRVTVLEGNKAGDPRVVFVIDEGPRHKVFWLNFVGNHFFSAARLKTLIQSHPPYLYLFSGEVDRKQIDEDVAKLTAYYRDFGFFRATVGRTVEFNEKQNWLTINFVIDEGPRYSVRNVSFLGNKNIDNSRLAEKLKLLGGQVFDKNQQNLDLQKIRDEYGGDGYVFAKVEADIRFLDTPGDLDKVDIVYNIDEGSRYRVGRINIEIKGENPDMKISTVLNRLSFKPGDIVDTREFRASERRLKATQIYKVEPPRPVRAKITYSVPAPEDKETTMSGQRQTTRFRVPGGQAPLPPGERYLDVNVDVECQGPETEPKDGTKQQINQGETPPKHPPATSRLFPSFAFRPFSTFSLKPFPKEYVSAWGDHCGPPYYNAEIKIIERKKGQPEKVVAAPKLRFGVGTACCSFVAECPFDDENTILVLTVSSSAVKQPVAHEVEAEWLRHGVVMASKMTLAAGGVGDKATGKARTKSADGSELDVVANIYRVKVSTSSARAANHNSKTDETENKAPVASTWGFAVTGKNVSIVADCKFETNGPEGKYIAKMPAITWSDKLSGEKAN